MEMTAAKPRERSYPADFSGRWWRTIVQEDPHAAGHRHRRGAGERGEHVADLRQGQQHAHHHGHPPAFRRPVEHQQRQQDGYRGTQVVRPLHQHPRPQHQRGREQDAPAEQCPHDAFPAACAALGQQRGQQHHRRVDQRREDGYLDRPQPDDRLDDHVQREFDGVEGHIPQPPAAQQQVAMQHVPRLQRLSRRVRVELIRLGLPQVAPEQHQADGRRGRHPRDPRVTPGPPREPPHVLPERRPSRASGPGGRLIGQPGVHPAPSPAWIGSAGAAAGARLGSASGIPHGVRVT